jgi:hypothetical protein
MLIEWGIIVHGDWGGTQPRKKTLTTNQWYKETWSEEAKILVCGGGLTSSPSLKKKPNLHPSTQIHDLVLLGTSSFKKVINSSSALLLVSSHRSTSNVTLSFRIKCFKKGSLFLDFAHNPHVDRCYWIVKFLITPYNFATQHLPLPPHSNTWSIFWPYFERRSEFFFSHGPLFIWMSLHSTLTTTNLSCQAWMQVE